MLCLGYCPLQIVRNGIPSLFHQINYRKFISSAQQQCITFQAVSIYYLGKVYFTLEQATKAQRGCEGIVLLFL